MSDTTSVTLQFYDRVGRLMKEFTFPCLRRMTEVLDTGGADKVTIMIDLDSTATSSASEASSDGGGDSESTG